MVLAHPDDEVIALGGRLERLSHSRLLTLTDGAPLDGADARAHGFTHLADYRTARQKELAAALEHAGLTPAITEPPTDVDPIPVPDQTAALQLAPLTRAVAAAIRAFAPEAVLTHPYEGGHPDHDACAFAVHTALRLLATTLPHQELPIILEAPSYHGADEGNIRTGDFLPHSDAPQPIVCQLSAPEQANKRARLACFSTQAQTLAPFGVERELFRLAPAYDFTKAPHTGSLFYERFPWGMTGDGFRTRAAQATAELFTTSAAPAHSHSEPRVEPSRQSTIATA